LSGSLVCTAGCAPPATEQPPFVDQLITRFESGEKKNPPGSIWRYRYKELVVFYVPPSCCDVPGSLYDENGALVCEPDGGISGKGDGRCPDFFTERTEELRVWTDNR
jgi:hypothetical protein